MPKGIFPRRRLSLHVRFWRNVNAKGSTECWEWKTGDGTHYPNFGMGGRGAKQVGANRFALEMKLGRRLAPGENALHTCDNKRCVNPNHLYAGTPTDNSRDMVERGRKERGADVYGAKLTEDVVLRLREMYATGKYSLEDLAEEVGASPSNVSMVVRGLIWGHVGGPLATKNERNVELTLRGEHNHQAVLTKELVLWIRSVHLELGVTRIARQLGVSEGAIAGVVKRRTWKHV